MQEITEFPSGDFQVPLSTFLCRNKVHLTAILHAVVDSSILFPILLSSSGRLYFPRSPSEINDVACSIEIVASSPLLKRFNGSTADLVKDIYLQTEMINILYRKMNFKSNNGSTRLNFHIDSIVSGKEDKTPFKEFIKKFGKKKSVCLVIGMDMTSQNSTAASNHSEQDNTTGACSKTNSLIVSHGATDHPVPMASFLASYLIAISHALGANDTGCHKETKSNPLVGIEKYFLSKEIKPDDSNGVFSQCNVEEIEKKLPTKKCLKNFNYSTCGNAIREDDEQCDCGPKEHCDEIDNCCIPPLKFSNRTSKSSNNTKCAFRSQKQCSKNDPCCDQCKFSKKGKKCFNEKCDNGFCNGKSGECVCVENASYQASSCKGLECAIFPCAIFALGPCLCNAKKDECLVCCMQSGSCQTLTNETIKEKNRLFAFPDGSPCSKNGHCRKGKCIHGKEDTSKAKIAKAEVVPFFTVDKNGTAANETHSGANYLKNSKIFVIFLLFTLRLSCYLG